jgi:3-deoxy-manno-octulosonate cytidylyltransferase (CMP-KDO synthetase)
MKIIGVIPARMESSRFPGKPLADIHNVPMIGHCYHRAKMCPDLAEVYVATCDEEIAAYVTSIGGRAILTSPLHNRASDRTAEAVSIIERETGETVDIVVMIQGDEPMITPEMVSASLHPIIHDEKVNVVNLMAKMHSTEEFEDPNEVKVVVDMKRDAIYFSREPIPSRKKGGVDIPMLKQVCVIPFRRRYLDWFNSLPETTLEKIESVDMLRLIENGDKVRMVLSEVVTYSVDTPQDLEVVKEKMRDDRLMKSYLR